VTSHELSVILDKALALIADGFYPECRELLEPLQARFGNEPGYQNILAMALYRLNEHEAAAEHYLAAIKLDPMDATPYVGIGKCLIKNLQDEEAEKYLKLGLLLDPQHAEALMGLGLIYINRQNYTEGESCFLRALEQFPADPGVLNNLGNICSLQGRYREAATYFDRAIQRDPSHAAAYTNRAMLRLASGALAEGWEDYEYRWDSGHFMARRFQNLPAWQGPSDPRKVVLIWAEQGLGDELMFASMFSDLEKLPQRFIIECDIRLIRIFSHTYPSLTFVPKTSITDTGPIECQFPIGSLGRIFRRSREQFPLRPEGYLRLESEQLPDELLAFLSRLSRPLIGVSWESYALTENFRGRKSISAGEFSELTRFPEATFINLQYGNPHRHEARKGALQLLPDELITLPGLDLRKNVEGVVALMRRLDHIITIGNSVAHLCGAFGIKASVLLPSVPDWRWAHRNEDFPWYQNLDFIRNTTDQNWSGPLQKARDVVRRFTG
jgi:Flp pilus assembly protein TadD